MPNFYIRLVFIPTLFFTAALLLIHAQPYDDHELRELLLPEGCPAPCFMGIRPGVTTMDEAIKILETSEWVSKIEYQTGDRIIKLKWNAKRPAWLENNGLYGGASVWIKDGLVTDFRIDTNISLGNIQLILGQTSFQYVSLGNIEGHTYLFYSAVYPNFGIFTDVSNSCNGQRNDITFQDKVYLIFAQFINEPGVRNQYADSWIDLLRISCN